MLRESQRVLLLGILSSGGVHGHQDHLFKIIEILGKKKEVLLHCFLDGRDSSPVSGYDNMSVLMEKIKRDNDRIDIAKLETLKSKLISPRRLAISPIHMECKLYKIIDLPSLASNKYNQL